MTDENAPKKKKGDDGLVFKTLVMGGPSVGKTSLVRRYVHNVFFDKKPNFSPGVDFALKGLQHENNEIAVQLWDIKGDKLVPKLSHVYFQKALAALTVCDVTDPQSFESAVTWKETLDKTLCFPNTSASVPSVLMLTKSDLTSPSNSPEELTTFCKRHGFCCGYVICSAKTGDGVAEGFLRLVDAILWHSSARIIAHNHAWHHSIGMCC